MKLNPFEVLGGLVFLGVLGVICWPVYATSGRPTGCMLNLHSMTNGFAIYATEADDRLPGRDVWMDSIDRYYNLEGSFRDIDMPKGDYGYAFNANLSKADDRKLPSPDKVLLVYDSVNPVRNASDLVTSVPAVGRHKGKNNFAYLDGHVKSVPGEKSP